MVGDHGTLRSLSDCRKAFHCVSVLAVSTWSPPETSSSAFGLAASDTLSVSAQPAPSLPVSPDEPICGSPKNRKSKSPSNFWVLNVYVADQPPSAPTRYEYSVFSCRPSTIEWPLKPPLTVLAVSVAANVVALAGNWPLTSDDVGATCTDCAVLADAYHETTR